MSLEKPSERFQDDLTDSGSEMIDDQDDLCAADFDVNAYINKHFPTEQSLSKLDSYIEKIETEISDLDLKLGDRISSHGKICCEGVSALKEAQTVISELEATIQQIYDKARSSEDSVYEMTKDIRKLDVAKKNLTNSITTLHHLHLLITGVNSLTTWISNRQYAEIALELPTVLNVLQLFENYTNVEQVKNLTEKVEKMKNQLSTQLSIDLRQQFKSGRIGQSTAEMCKVISVLGNPVRDDFCKWYVEQQLAVYNVLFAESEDVAWIDKIEERYRWFVNKLSEFEKTGVSKVFPPPWELSRKLAMEFCLVTKHSLDRMMFKRKIELEWKLLVHAINHTIMFENLLTKKFPKKDNYNFEKIIWPIFDKYMDVFINAQRKNLDQFLNECSARIRSHEEIPKREISTTAIPLPSSANLFLLIKKIITESGKLFSGKDQVLAELEAVFASCLRDYAHGCLSAFLPQIGSSTSSGLLQSLMREETSTKLTLEQQFLCCCILSTADWCAETTMQLQDKIKQRIGKLCLTQEVELFYGITNNALAVLVQDAEITCDASLQAMAKTNWSSIEAVGDESPYVSSIQKSLRSIVPQVREYFADRRKYFAHFCLKLTQNFVNKFLGTLFRCKPITVTGAEQLLLDTHALKTFLQSMPSIESLVTAKPPTAYMETLNKGMTKAEMVLKAVMAEISNPEEFVEHYARLLPASDSTELQKVLEMRLIRRSDQLQIIQLYRSRFESQTTTPSGSAPLSISAVIGESSSIKRLEKFVRRI